jgi:hypothetical protein
MHNSLRIVIVTLILSLIGCTEDRTHPAQENAGADNATDVKRPDPPRTYGTEDTRDGKREASAADKGDSAHEAPILDVKRIAGKRMEEVESILGQAVHCEDGKYGRKCDYGRGDIEIVFIGGKADWISVDSIAGADLSENPLHLLGLTSRPPVIENEYVMRWDDGDGLLSVTIFKSGGNSASSAYIKTRTP